MPSVIDITGMKFGRLTVSKHIGRGSKKSRNHFWLCLCDCGASVSVNGSCLRRGATKSCGCYQKDVARAAGDRTKTHGKTKTTTYNVWTSMVQRCNNENAKDYPRYGAIGITVCEEWHTFENFLRDMGERPSGMSLDRINNNSGYSKANCRWTDAKTQQRNKRNTSMLTHNGESMTLQDWAERIGMNPITLADRIYKGWSVGDAITKPVMKMYSHQKNRKAYCDV